MRYLRVWALGAAVLSVTACGASTTKSAANQPNAAPAGVGNASPATQGYGQEGNPTSPSPSPSASGPAITVTTTQGYRYKVQADPPQTTLTQVGQGAPPGQVFLVFNNVTITNLLTDRPEAVSPLLGGQLDVQSSNLYIAVPKEDWTKFGMKDDSRAFGKVCGLNPESPPGLCKMITSTGVVSPSDGLSFEPTLQAGQSAVVALGLLSPIPQTAPLADVALFLDRGPDQPPLRIPWKA